MTTMQTYSKSLINMSYGDIDTQAAGPYELIIRHLMQTKADFLYPSKQALIALQLQLIDTAHCLREHAGDPKKAEAMLLELRKFQAHAKKIIAEIDTMEKIFQQYSDALLQETATTLPNALNTLIAAVEEKSTKTLTSDIKSLLFNDNGMPLSFAQLTALLTERGIAI